MRDKVKYNLSDAISNISGNFFEYLLLVLRSAAVYIFINRSLVGTLNTYSFQKKRKPENISKVILPPEIKEQCKLADLKTPDDLAKEYKDFIIYFTNTISSSIKDEDLSLFYKNMASLKVKSNMKKIFYFLFGKGISGRYNMEKNSILLVKDYDELTFYHELFHAASSIIDKNNYYYSGFSISPNDSTVIGNGINEGYTVLLTERFFEPDKNVSSTYHYLKYIAVFLEAIVGQDKMENFYFNANLYGLINELKKYSTDGEIMKFIANTDFILEYFNSKEFIFAKKTTIKKSIKEVSIFLIYSYANKLRLINETHHIDRRTTVALLSNFISLFGAFVVDKETYDLAPKNILNEVMDNVFGDDDINIKKN